MASPLTWFRKNQKSLLVVFGVLLMVSFLIVPVLLDMNRGTAGGGGRELGATAVSWKGGQLTNAELEGFRTAHYRTIQFLESLMQSVGRDDPNFRPKAQALETIDARAQQEGVTREQALVRTLLLAEEANKIGLVVSDQAIYSYLSDLCDSKIAREDERTFKAHFRNASEGNMAYPHMIEQLRIELLAEQMRMLSFSGVANITPGVAYDYSNRISRSVKLEVLPVFVQDYVKNVKAKPTPSELNKLYEDGKRRFPHADSDQPGFRRRHKIAVEYVKADYDKFLQAAIATVTEEDIKKYEEEKKNEFDTLEAEAKGDKDEKTDEKKDDVKDDKSADEKKPEGSGTVDGSAAEKKTEQKPEKENDEPTKDSESKDKKAEQPSSDPKKEKTDDPGAPCVEGDESDDEEVETKDNEASKKKENDGAAKKDEATEDKTATPDANKSDANKTDAKEPDKKAEGSDTTGTSDPADPATKPTDETGATGDKVETPEEAAAKKREETIRKIAEPKAKEAMKTALEAAKNEIEGLFFQYIEWELDKSKPRPDFSSDVKKVAKKNDLEYGSEPLLDVIEIGETEIGQSFVMDFREISFAEILFSDERKPYSPRVIQNLGVGDYLYWKTEEKEGYIPEFDEVREEVEAAWSFQEARQLAREAADEHAANARNAKDQSLKNLFKDDATELPEFTWLSMGGGNTPFAMMGGGIPELTEVFGVDRAGPEFMATAYALRKGEIGVAPNSPKSTYYVIRVSEDGWRDDLKNQFLMMKYFMSNMPPQQRRPQAYEMAALRDRFQFQHKWMDELVESKGVKWIRDPQ